MKNVINTAWILPAIIVACMFVGCAEYRLGSTLPSNIRSVYVPTFVNNTGEPLIENQTTGATIADLQKDGTLRVASVYAQADSLVTVTLSKYTLEPVRYERDDVKTANEYRVKIEAKLLFEQLKPRKVLAERTVVGESTFIVSGDMASAKSSALPKASEDLAHKIVESMVEAW